MIGTNDLERSRKFYDIVLPTIGLSKIITTERYIGYGDKNKNENIEFYITRPFNKEKASYGNGTQISFLVKSKLLVEKFYNTALKNGAIDEGEPGTRSELDYYAYFRDLDGNKICAYSKKI